MTPHDTPPMSPVTTIKLWGWEETITNNPKYCGKLLTIKPGYRCSLHYHNIKDETFMALNGTIKVEYWPDGPAAGQRLVTLHGEERHSLHIPPGVPHRFWTPDSTRAEFVEFSTTHSDDDVVRLEPSSEYRERS